jgi:hypothetical protein
MSKLAHQAGSDKTIPMPFYRRQDGYYLVTKDYAASKRVFWVPHQGR